MSELSGADDLLNFARCNPRLPRLLLDRQVQEAKATIDTRAPESTKYTHLKTKHKKIQVSPNRILATQLLISAYQPVLRLGSHTHTHTHASARRLVNLLTDTTLARQMEEARKMKIDHENQVLIQKMSRIMLTSGGIDNRNNFSPRRYSCSVHTIATRQYLQTSRAFLLVFNLLIR